jgi:hypothetical protein
MRFNLKIQDWENMFILSHIIIDTFCMYMNQITSKKIMNLIHHQWFAYECALTFKCICTITHAFNTWLHNNNNVGCIHLYFVKNHIWKLHENWNVTKITPKNNGNDVYVHYNITFSITKKSNYFMPYFFTTMFCIHVKQTTSNKDIGRSHPFSNVYNLITTIHAFWMTFNYNIYVNHAFNTPHGNK